MDRAKGFCGVFSGVSLTACSICEYIVGRPGRSGHMQ